MKRGQKILLSRLVVATIAVAAFLAMMLIVNTFFTVTFDSRQPVKYMAMLFAGIAYLLAWVISLCWKSNRDTMIHEMGYIELHMYRAAIEQQIDERNGKKLNVDYGVDYEVPK